jgi:hypothetical protein
VTPRAAVAIAVCAALLVAGCGGGGGERDSFTGPDPASLTPADAPLFNEAVVRPEGDQKEAVDGALSKLLATDDPGGFVVDRLDQALADQDAGIAYEQDIAPWLGPRVGAFVETFSAHSQAAVLVSTTDPAASQETIDKAAAASEGRERKRAYRGVGYTVFPRDDSVAGIVGDFVVGGPEQAFKDAVDASRGGSLADSDDFAAQLEAAPDDRIYFAYAEPQSIVDALEKSGELTAGQLRAAGPQVHSLLSQPATASVSAAADDVSLELSAAQGPSSPTPRESPLLSDFPSDSWLAFASSDAGAALGQGLGAAERAIGFDLGAQLGHWAGDIGGFARGTSLFGLGGALVLETTDERASAQTLDELRRRLSAERSLQVSPLTTSGEEGFSFSPAGVPIQVQVVQRDGKVVAGLPDSVEAVFSPSSTLGDSDAFNAATDALGEDFSPLAFLDFEPLFQLVGGLPQVQSDPDYQSAKPYLDHLSYLAVGARSDQGTARVRVILGLRDSPPEGTGASATASAAVVAR